MKERKFYPGLKFFKAAKEQRKPYVVVFVGVNGVGKSTNLAKVVYWLLQHDVSVMMAACDTFRSASANPRLIDGILLTKFDTIDDKVGAALSMVYISGAPVMFVGCGQSYTDLKKLNVKSIVKTLLR
ncbi:hypothetical protein QN277_023767 [Acacia crassicarpa]|uniref:SRP54-type proteins GTP-binding domain-containing protein n=1 Tax=Acacia crassicarpa TaxID=499986 RepID=A0AAE1JAG8_9FABA|nr:hypothetical protein QN277_023767 [Acacia crassicarpa]